MERSTYIRERYGRSQALVNLREQRRVRALVERAGRFRPRSTAASTDRFERILDLPSGVGRFTPTLRARARQVVCGDLSRERLRALRGAERPETDPPPALLVCDLGAALPFADRSFDLVFTFRFFQHVREAELRNHVAAELVRVCAGGLIVSYYDTAPLHRLHTKLWRRPGHSRDLAHRRRADFLALFEGLGCEVVEDGAVLPFVHANRVALLRRCAAS